MKNTITIAVALAAALSPIGAATAAGSKATYDGTWSVRIVTEAGPCDASYNYAVAIEDGRVQRAGGSDEAVITGQIGPDGTIGIGLRNGPASADASGRLKAATGSGTWSLAMLGCSGHWTAQRRTIQARAS